MTLLNKIDRKINKIKDFLYGPPLQQIEPIYKCPYCDGEFIIFDYDAFPTNYDKFKEMKMNIEKNTDKDNMNGR